MSEEFRLDAELAELESQLGELAPSNSKVDRETLLYQAGWEAALAMKSGRALPSRDDSVARYSSVGFAALSAVLAFLLMRPVSEPGTDVVSVPRDVVQLEQIEQPADPPLRIEVTEAVVPIVTTSKRYPSMRRTLSGRRDLERWLRETDRMVTANVSSEQGRSRTIQEWYREIRADGMQSGQDQNVGEQL